MKIALVVPGGVDRSGTDRVIPVLLWLIERLVRGGDEVHVFALRQEPSPAQWKLLGAAVHNAGKRPRRLRTLASLMREHRRSRFDVVHAFWAGAPAQAAALFGRLGNVPLVITLAGGDLAGLPDVSYGAQLTRRGRIAISAALSRASAIIAPSEWLAAQAGAQGWPTITIPFGVALDRWPPAAPRPRTGGAPVRLIHVASLNRVKDQTGLLDAIRLLADKRIGFRLDIFGEDTLNGAVQRHCSALGLDEIVRFHGFVPNAELRARFDNTDLLVMNSRHEAACMVMLEAATVGIPTIGTAVGYMADWAPDAAVAVPVGDPTALALAIAELAGNEPGRLRLARAAHARATTYEADKHARDIRRIYADVAVR